MTDDDTPTPKPRLLRTDLPADVWDRLDAEAHAHGQKIGAYVKALIVNRDARKQAAK